MKNTILIAAAAVISISGSAHAQRFVGQDSVRVLPAPAIMDTAGMFLARYARVGDDLFIAGQPTERALREMQKLGVTTVINLRMPQEMARIGFDEEKLIAELGMKYVHIPMRGGTGPNSYSPETLRQFSEALRAANGKVLLHCTVAWRASHIWAAHLIQNGVSDVDAVRHAREINLMDTHRMDDSGKQPIEMFLNRSVKGLGQP
jgi:uncharacterized protein (TIGR01244 family)